MNIKILTLALLVSSFGSSVGLAQQHWNEGQITSAFTLLENGQGEQLVALLANWGTTPHDLGIDILQQGRGELALTWFEQLGNSVSEDFLFGLAWSQRAMGDSNSAFETLRDIEADENLLNARKHYLLGLLFFDQNQIEAALAEIENSEALYVLLGKAGGVQLCKAVTVLLTTTQIGGTTGTGGISPRDENDG